jgi:hypothetical protein
MPVEGQWERARTPFTTREKRVLVGLVVVLAALAVVLGVVAATNKDTVPVGCIRASVASTMGGNRFEVCGAKAKALCVAPGISPSVVSACRREGYATGKP